MGNTLLNLYQKSVRKEWKTAFLAALILGFCVHIYKFTNTLPGHDSLYNYYHTQNIVGSGRWFLMIACGLSSFHDLPWLIGLFSMVYLAITAVIVADHFRIENPIVLILCSGLIVAYPSITETLFFEFTADGYFLAMLMAALAARLTRMDTITPKRMAISGVLICLSCAIYQAYVSVALVLSICGFILELLENKRSVKECWKWVFCHAVIYVVSLASYYVIWQIMMKLQGVTANDYRGISTLSSFGLHTLVSGVRSMITTLLLFFFEWNFLKRGLTVYGGLNLLLLAALAVVLVTAVIKSGLHRRRQHLLLGGLCLIALPVSICIWHFSSDQVWYLPRMLGSTCILLIFALVLADRWCKPKFSDLVGLVAAVMILNNGIQANISYYYMDRCYERSYATAVEMIVRIRPLAEETGVNQIAIAGSVRTDIQLDANEEIRYLPQLSPMLENTLLFDHIHTKMYMEEMFDLEYTFVKDIEALEISRKDEVAEMGIWPVRDSVKVIGDTIVIKLDEFEEGEWHPSFTVDN